MKLLNLRQLRWVAPAMIATAFVLWSSWFIFRTSFLIEGKRYFSLFGDAMISMRYAWNLAHGYGLVWNVGERVEGYTNLLMTLTMAIPNYLFDKAAATLSIQILGLVLMLLIAFLSIKIGERVLRSDMQEYKNLTYALVTLGILSYYPLVFWSLMGMETGLLSMLLLVAVLFCLQYADEGSKFKLYLAAVSLGLAFLTRNDSIIFAILLFAFVLLVTLNSPTISIRPLLLAGSIFALFVLFQEAFRYLYYGQLLPNTYFLKVADFPLDLRFANGIGFIIPFLKESFALVFLACLSLVSCFSMRRILLLLFFVLSVLYQIWVGGDPWMLWRITAPSMPLIIILAIIAIVEIVASLKNASTNGILARKNGAVSVQFRSSRTLFIVLIAVSTLVPGNKRFIGQIIGSADPYTAEANANNVRRALAISNLTGEKATIGVFWAGSIPYYSGRQAIDFLGKSDKYIASLSPDLTGATGWNGMISVPGHNKYDLNYSILKLKPTYIQNVRWGAQDLSQWAAVHYEEVEANGIDLLFLKDSNQVEWQKIVGD